MKTILSILALIAIGVFAWYILERNETVPIAAEYPGKIVYQLGTGTSEEVFQNDCRERGGTFNSCGSSCAPDAEICTLECAMVCELPGGEPAWDTYENDSVGYSIPYRSDMEVGSSQSPYGTVIRFSLWGPTQEANTEFYDGVSVSIYQRELAEDETLEDVIAEEIGQTEQVGEILEPVTETELAGLEGFQFRSYTVGAPQDRIYLQQSETEILVLTVSAPDPTAQGYEAIAQRMIDGLAVAESTIDEEETE